MASVGKRKAERRGCQVKAQVLQPDRDPIDCLILDFSATGARVKLNAPINGDLPSRFKLYIPSRPETKNVILRWTKGQEIGVEYSTGLADEKTFFELIDRVAKLEKGGASGDPAALEELAKRITTLEARLAEQAPDEAEEVDLDEGVAATLERRIDKATKTAENQIKRSEQFLSTRMDQTEERLRALLAPDVAERLARLEALAEGGSLAPAAAEPADATLGPDPRIVSRLADLEAKIMSAQRPAGVSAAQDVSAIESRLETVARLAEERAERVERFLMTRIDDIETQMIAAPAAPAPARSSEIADLDFKLHELTARFEEMIRAEAPAAPAPVARTAAPHEFARLVERVSDLEVSIMELRIDGPAAGSADSNQIEHRIAEIEGRHAEIIGTLRNLLALLTATEGRRQAG